MPDCPAGSHIKPAAEPYLWLEPAAVCLAVGLLDSPWLPYVDIACSLFIPQLIDIEKLCQEGPPPYPEIDWETVFKSGPAHMWMFALAPWFYAAWVNANWAVHCECIPTGGTGPCSPIAATPGSVAGNFATGWQRAVRLDIGYGWDTIWTYIRAVSTSGGYYFRLHFIRANETTAYVSNPTLHTTSTAASSQSFSKGTVDGGNTANIRHLEMWIQNYQTGTAYTSTASLEVSSYIGSCTQDTTVTPPPPEQNDPGDPPNLPPPPEGPSGCTVDTLCTMLYGAVAQLQRTGQLVEALQRYTLPFGTIPGTPHGPLTGAGSFAIGDLVAMQVTINSGEQPRTLEGAPLYQWDLGWMSVMDDNGMIIEKRITRTNEMWFPRIMQEATTFGYWLKEGVEATFTEQLPQMWVNPVSSS